MFAFMKIKIENYQRFITANVNKTCTGVLINIASVICDRVNKAGIRKLCHIKQAAIFHEHAQPNAKKWLSRKFSLIKKLNSGNTNSYETVMKLHKSEFARLNSRPGNLSIRSSFRQSRNLCSSV